MLERPGYLRSSAASPAVSRRRFVKLAAAVSLAAGAGSLSLAQTLARETEPGDDRGRRGKKGRRRGRR